MPIQAPQWTDFRLCPVCQNEYNSTQKPPISLGCGHSICQCCLFQLSKQQCPFDQADILIDIKKLPINYALLSLVGGKIDAIDVDIPDLKDHEQEFNRARKAIEVLAQSLQNVVITGTSANNSSYASGNVLTRPMQRKLVTLIHSQLAEAEGRSRAMRAARSIGERAVKELILMHQNPQTLSTALWAAVRQRGCQFLGPAMQEAVLRLIVLSLEDGISLSRKVLVLFVVQRLEKQFTQASKTSIGHVVQLLYRASCFKVTKREGDSSLLQLQEKYRTYSALRKEHDAQIVQIAMEAGLHISPEQWSALLYGDDEHKSHMQSIIDKLQTPASFASSIQELIIALQRTSDPHNLQGLRPHLDKLSLIDPSPEVDISSWEQLDEAMQSLLIVVTGLQSYAKEYASRNKGNIEGAQMINTKYRTSMCRDILQKNSCPRGANCNFAHSEDELEKYRKRRNLSCSRPPMMNGCIGINGNGISYASSRTGSSSSPDSCIAADFDDDDLGDMNKMNHSPGINGTLTFPQPGGMGMNRPPVTMYMDPQDGNNVSMIDSFKNMTIQQQQHAPYNSHYSQQQMQLPKKNEQLIKLPPTYEMSLHPQMQQQRQQQQPPQAPPRPSIYHQQAPPYHQPSYIELREPQPPPQPQPAMYLQSHQTPYVTSAQVYQPPPQMQQQYMPYQQLEYQQQHYPNHPFHGQQCFMQRTALARDADGRDYSDLLKTNANPTSELSLSIPSKDDEWTKFGTINNNSSNNNSKSGKGTTPFDGYIDSGRGSSVGYSSASDTFSPLSNSSIGSRGSPQNDSECDRKFFDMSIKNIWNSTDTKMNGWTTTNNNNNISTTKHVDRWDLLNEYKISDTEDRNSSTESVGKNSDHQSTTLDEERSYSYYLKDLPRSNNTNNNNNADIISNGSSKSSNQSLLGFSLLSPTARRPPPGFTLI